MKNKESIAQAHRNHAVRLFLILCISLAAGIFLWLAAGYVAAPSPPRFCVDHRETAAGIAAAAGPSGNLNINTATLEQLDALPGIGPALANAILTHRQENGQFFFVEGIMDVSGIGEKRFEALQPLICCSPLPE